MSKFIHKSHNILVILYHLVCPAKYRRVVFANEVGGVLRDTCIEISKRYEIVLLKIGTDLDHAHFLIQSVPSYSPHMIMAILSASVYE